MPVRLLHGHEPRAAPTLRRRAGTGSGRGGRPVTRSTEKLRTEAVTHVEIMLDHASRDVSGQLVIDALCVRLYAGLEVLSRIDPASRVLTGGELECTEGVRFGFV